MCCGRKEGKEAMRNDRLDRVSVFEPRTAKQALLANWLEK